MSDGTTDSDRDFDAASPGRKPSLISVWPRRETLAAMLPSAASS